MKKTVFLLTIFLIVTSCAATNEAGLSKSDLRNAKKTAEEAIVKNAVESRRFIIKLDRMYFGYGGRIDLYPRANYIIIDGEKAIISTAYMGRQYGIRPIAGINMFGRPTNYELTTNISKGIYEVKTLVKNESNSFDLYVTIGRDGNCSVSLNNFRLDYVTYKGFLVPIKSDINLPLQDIGVI